MFLLWWIFYQSNDNENRQKTSVDQDFTLIFSINRSSLVKYPNLFANEIVFDCLLEMNLSMKDSVFCRSKVNQSIVGNFVLIKE